MREPVNGPVAVVLVDDAADVRSVVSMELRLSGRFVVVAEGATGADAVRLAAAHRPRLMLLDISTPGVDGLEALPAIREASPGTRVVMLSGFVSPAVERAALSRGANAFVDKGAPIRDLPERLLGVLEGDSGGPPVARAQSGPAPAPTPAAARGGAQATPASATSPDGGEPPENIRAEAVMAEHLERFRTVFDRAAVGMATMTLTGTIVRVNQAFVDMLAATEDDLVGRRYSDLVGAERLESATRVIESVASGRHDVAELEHPLVYGEAVRWVHATAIAVRGGEGRPMYLFAQLQDVTDRRQAAMELRASEERFRLLVEGVRDYAIFMLDPEGRVTTWNLGAERMKGYRAGEIIGRHFRVFYPEEAQDRRHPEHELELAARDGRYEEEGWRIRKDGGRFWANVVITALFDDGELVGFAKVTRDVTERRLAMEALEAATADISEANVRLTEAAEQTSQFVAVTAHELRSPISVMTGAADILTRHWDRLEPAERREALSNMSLGAARLRRLLDDLLTVSRLEAGSFRFQVEDFSVRAAIDDSLAGMTELAGTVEVTGADGARARGDEARVVQILSNLLSNAVRYGRPPVRIDVRSAEGMVEVRVVDSGTDVTPDLARRLFDKFVQGPGGGKHGSGLGLFIVRQLARAQGGDAWFERDRRGASCFAFSLPAADHTAQRQS